MSLRKSSSAVCWWVVVLILASPLLLLLTTPPVLAESFYSFSDDFSGDTGMWEYSGFAWPNRWGEGAEYYACRDAAEEYVVLTPNDYDLAGALWLQQDFTSSFTASFRFLAGGGEGADGLVMMFYHEKPPFLWSGGCLSFIGSGYGIELDNYPNYGEPAWDGGPLVTDPTSNPHIAIVKDNPSNHLAYSEDLRIIGDNEWHSVAVIVDWSSITVYMDSYQVLRWEGSLDRTQAGLGFSGTTGSYTNQHLIDDFSISVMEVPATIDFDPDTLNLRSIGETVTVYVELPTGYDVNLVDISSIRLDGTVPALAKPTSIGDHDMDAISDLMVKFDRAAVQQILSVGDQVEIAVTGRVGGIDFKGTDTISVIS